MDLCVFLDRSIVTLFVSAYHFLPVGSWLPPLAEGFSSAPTHCHRNPWSKRRSLSTIVVCGYHFLPSVQESCGSSIIEFVINSLEVRSMMEVVRRKHSAHFSDALKLAVNAYHVSIGHHCPYDDVSNGDCLLPVEVTCIWPDSEVLNNEDTCTYICDTASLDRLQTITNKVTILDRGLAWPHVNFSAERRAVNWIMFREDVRKLSGFPCGKEWFIVSQHVRDLLDYNVGHHNLVATRSKVTFIHPVFGLQRDISLTSIISDPGNLSVSVYPSRCSEEKYPASSDPPPIHLFVAGNNREKCNSDDIWTDTELKYHDVTSQVPTFLLQSILSHVCQCRISHGFMKHETSLQSELTIKEEPLVCEEFPLCVDVRGNEKHVIATQSVKKRQQEVQIPVRRNCVHRNWTLREVKCLCRTVLHCPKCTVTFSYGLTGLDLLIGHVYDDHKRLLSYCTLIIKQKYTELVKMSVKCGKSYFCNA